MGRNSRRKRERRERGEGPIAAMLEGRSPESLISLLEAASVSPTAAHRGPSIASLFFEAAMHCREGTKAASPGILSKLVSVVSDVHPAIATLEDFQPYEGRSEVLIRWGPELFRLLPGSLERPTAMVDQHLLLAAAIDPVLIPRIGFGLFDVGELVLRRLDHVARTLSPHWTDGPAADQGDDVHVSQAEVDAAGGLRPLGEMLGDCVSPSRVSVAAKRYTFAAKRIAFDPSDLVSTFGTAVATRIAGSTVPLPAGFLLDAIPAIGVELAAFADKADERAEEVLAGTVGNRIGHLIQGGGQSIAGPIHTGTAGVLHSLVIFNDRQVLALDVAAGLTPGTIQQRLDDGASRLAQIRPGAEVRTPGGPWTLPQDAEVVRVQVVAGPSHAVPLRPKGPTMRLEDLEWILHTAQETPEDLWYFVRDLRSTRGVEAMFAWDMIDKWEVWRPQKSFYRGGATLTTMLFSPHAAVAEWESAAAGAPTERALHTLGLPPLRGWPIRVLDHRRGTEIGDLRTDRVLQVGSWTVPVAVHKTDSTAPRQHQATLWSLADGLFWKLDHSADAFIDAARRSNVASLQVRFEFRDRHSGPPLTFEAFADATLVIGWDDRLQGALADDSFAVETACGEIVSRSLAPSVRDEFMQAWEAAPPGIRVDGFPVRQRVQRLPEPLKLHDTVRADVLRELGEHLAGSPHEPAVLDGRDATRFESHTVFPWLVNRFHEAIADLSASSLLEFGLVQLECVHHHRFMVDKRLGWHRGFPVQGEPDTTERREPVARATRAISFIVEELLAQPPAGNHPADDLAWMDALAVADLCIESCFRSDAIHYRLVKTAVQVTNLYEVNVLESDEPTDVDMRAYARLRSKSTLPAAVPITTGQATMPEDVDDEPKAVVELMPELAPIDDAMRQSLGFGIDAVTGVLNVVTQWDADETSPARHTTSEVVVDQCAELATGATPEEYSAALGWLTLKGAELAADTIPHWETERRATRIATSPIIADGGGVWLLPWTAESTLRILANYLSDGRLPWPDTVLPEPVRQALGRYRQTQNLELEKECVAALDMQGFVVRGSVKPQKATHYGIPSLAGEIDALCIDVTRSRIWVIEAKDPYTPYSSRQVRRLIDDFTKPGKYVDRLLRKVGDITDCAASVAAALGIPDPSRAWSVQGLMVTRHIEPAAFAIDPKVPFCVIDDLVDVVSQDLPPAAGLQGPITVA